MNQKFIPVEEAFARWRQDPEYMKEYNALEEEFARAQMVIGARTTPTLAKPSSRSAWAPAKAQSPGWKADA